MKKKFLKLDEVRENTSKFEELQKDNLERIKGGVLVVVPPLTGMVGELPIIIEGIQQPLPGIPSC